MNSSISISKPRDGFSTEDVALLKEGSIFEVRGMEVNPAQHGYTIVHNYALYFGRPYLGNTAFGLWELLLSFCYGDCDVAYPSISRLARMLTNSDYSRAVVTGRRSAPRESAAPEAKETQARKQTRAAKRSCYQGALDVLCRERLLQVRRRGQGPTTRYTFRVSKSLPLLRPEQAAHLSPSLQRDHAAWLERYGIDEQAYRQAFDASAHGDRTGDGPRRGRVALHSTSNPQEKDPMNYWWQETLTELRRQWARSTFETYLLPTKTCTFQDGLLPVKVTGSPACDMLQRRLAVVIKRMLIAVSDGKVQDVHFVVDAACDEEGENPCGV